MLQQREHLHDKTLSGFPTRSEAKRGNSRDPIYTVQNKSASLELVRLRSIAGVIAKLDRHTPTVYSNCCQHTNTTSTVVYRAKQRPHHSRERPRSSVSEPWRTLAFCKPHAHIGTPETLPRQEMRNWQKYNRGGIWCYFKSCFGGVRPEKSDFKRPRG